MSTGLLLDGVFCSEHIDSSGEILDIAGVDITDFEEGRGLCNYEHQGHDNEKNQGQEIVGKVIAAHKLFSASDARNERERMFWDKVKLPFLYGVVRLYDGAGHEGAKALAAIIRDSHANNEPLVIGFSIEGSTLDHDKKTNRLKSTIARRVAITTRPCNKAAVSALLADPNAPEGYEKAPGGADLLAMVAPEKQTKKAESTDPMYRRLGGSEAIYGPEITKAMSAGMGGAAPGSLTQGSALQREDVKRVHRALALAAYRDWNRVTPFREFLKTRMPDASDEFLDHFTDLVDRQMFRVKKAAQVITDLRKKGKEVHVESKPQKPAASPLTIQGRPVPAPPAGTRASSFDPVAGQLTTPKGVFQASTPSNPHPHLLAHLSGKAWVGGKHPGREFQAELQEQRAHHQRAMQNWLKVNDQFVQGNLSPGLVSHGVAFALMSPGVPVPMQEAMYGHFVDALHATGHEHATAENWDQVRSNWMARSGGGLPEHSREHFRALESDLRAKAGHFIPFNKPGKFSEYYGDYLKHHHADVVNAIKEGRGDAHAVARRLTEVRGIAPKLSRYLLGMLGAGNLVVPDTHFIRHYFGARPEGPGQKPGDSPDSEAIHHLKQALLNSVNSHEVLEGIDQHYFQNHDAVKAVLADPTIGPYFKGREQQAIFPAFWWHWNSVPGHERRIGTPNPYASNAGTDHAPFWDAVGPMMKKAEEQHDPDLPLRTAMQHQRWVEEYGPVHALDLYYRYLVPRIVENDARAPRDLVRKFEALTVDLGVALNKAVAQQQPIDFGGRRVTPGSGQFGGEDVSLLEAGPKDFTAVPADRLGHHGPSDLFRIPRGHPALWVRSHPQTQDAPLRTSAHEHSVDEYNHHPETQALAHGFDFGAPREGAGKGYRKANNFWTVHNGAPVFVKGDAPTSMTPGLSEPRAEGVFSNLARDFFGLGQYVPHVAVVRHPQTGQEHAIIAHAPGHELEDPWKAHQDPVLQKVAAAGDLDKAAMMDMVMGNDDRHVANFLLDPEHGLSLIDHNRIFHNAPNNHLPVYWANEREPLHPEAQKWVHSLDPQELESQLRRHDVPEERLRGAVERLHALKNHLRLFPNASRADLWKKPYQEAAEKLP